MKTPCPAPAPIAPFTLLVMFMVLFLLSPATRAAEQTWVGSPRVPEGLNPKDLLLVEDFEGETTLLDDVNADLGGRLIVEGDAFDGGKAIRLHTLEDKISKKTTLPAAVEVAYARFMIKFVPGTPADPLYYLGRWKAAGSGEHFKMFGLYGRNNTSCPGDFEPTGYDCWSVRSRLVNPYLGLFRDMVGEAGVDHHATNVDKTLNAVDGKWHCLEMMVKMNTASESSAQRDGTVKFWVDGKETVLDGVMFRKTPLLKCNLWWWTWWSNDSFPGPMLFDSFVVSRARIGCPGSAPERDGVPPAAPQNLRREP